MFKRGHLNVPVIGVAKSGWNLDQFRRGHATASRNDGGLDPATLKSYLA